MSFTGDLDHLPIVDVIQLLAATRKSGILRVQGRKGESKLVFKDGYIVSASHLDNTVRIGNILVDLQFVTQEDLDRTLEEQSRSEEGRKPILVHLIESGLITKDEAYQALEGLIKLTIVQMLTWKKGTFCLDVKSEAVTEEISYYPERMGQEITVDAQSILMDALRIFDEKMRDGEIEEEQVPEEEENDEEFQAAERDEVEDFFALADPTAPVVSPPAPSEEPSILSAEDLGLDDLDQLERRIPGVFAGIQDAEPDERQRHRIREVASGLFSEEQEELLSYLMEFSAETGKRGKAAGSVPAVVLYSSDQLIRYAVEKVCKPEGIPVVATEQDEALLAAVDGFSAQGLGAVLVFDSPGAAGDGLNEEQIVSLRRRCLDQFSRLPAVQLASPLDYAFSLTALGDGVRCVLPRPIRAERKGTFVKDTIQFLETFRSYIKGAGRDREARLGSRLKKTLSEMRERGDAPEISLAVLRFVAEVFDRAVTLVVRSGELVPERGIGISAAKSAGASSSPGFRIPLSEPSVFLDAVEEGRLFYGSVDDPVADATLYAAVGKPRIDKALLLPMQSRGRTVFLTYADFGDEEAAGVPLDLLEILAAQAGLILENAFYRKKLEKRS